MLPGQAAQHKVAQGTPIVFTMAIPLADPQPARARALAKASGMQKHVSRNCVSEGLPLRTPLYIYIYIYIPPTKTSVKVGVLTCLL